MRFSNTVLLAVLCASAPYGLSAQNGAPDSAAGGRLALPADTLLRTGRLANGLTYFVRPDSQEHGRAELRLVVRAGTVLEDADQRGLAHFVEHMAFNGTRRFPRNEIVAWLERLGMRFGPDVNAYTNLDETVYRLTVPTDSGALERGVQVLEDWAASIAFDPAQIARERGVVVEEWRAGLGALARVQEREYDFLFAGSPYAGRRVLGDAEAVQRFDPASLERFYRDWYRPDLMAVVAVGDFDGARVEQLIRDGFGAIPASADARPRPDPAVPLGRGPRYLATADPELTFTLAQACWTRAAAPRVSAAGHVDALATRMFVSMLNQRLEDAARRPGAPFVEATAVWTTPLRPVQMVCVLGVAPEGAAGAALAGLLTEAERVARDGFTPAELRREAQERQQRLLSEAEAGVSAYGAADAYVAAFLAGEPPVPPAEEAGFERAAIPAVTLEAANAHARAWLRAPDRVAVVRAPERAGAAGADEAALARVADSVAVAAIAPYGGAAAAEARLPRDPRPGRIVREDSVPWMGLVRWTLSNGARVVLRRWGGAGGEVHLLATSRGGLSMVPDSLFVEATASPLVVASGGVASLSAAELQRQTAGQVRLSFFVDAASEGMWGMAERGRLKPLLRLAHLHFTAPRLDTAAWGVTVRRVQETYAGRHASPAQALADTLQAVLGTDDPREPASTPESLGRVDPARALAVFRERFADASDFTFYIAGELEPEQVRPLVERYLASLPGAGGRETPRDLGARPPSGVVVRTVRAGRDAAGGLAIVFGGEAKLSREARRDVENVAAVLQHRLRTRLRDELGLVYDEEVTAWIGDVPVPSYQVVVVIPAAPERLREVARIVFESVDSLRAHGASPDEVLRVREAERRALQQDRFSNLYWLNELRAADEYGWDPDAIGVAPPSTALTPLRMRAAARRYLNPRRYVQVTLVPADPPASADGKAAAPPRE